MKKDNLERQPSVETFHTKKKKEKKIAIMDAKIRQTQ
jgi:hypothetical protein